jgi:hypothetical protein
VIVMDTRLWNSIAMSYCQLFLRGGAQMLPVVLEAVWQMRTSPTGAE